MHGAVPRIISAFLTPQCDVPASTPEYINMQVAAELIFILFGYSGYFYIFVSHDRSVLVVNLLLSVSKRMAFVEGYFLFILDPCKWAAISKRFYK